MQQSADSLEAAGISDFVNKWLQIGPKQRLNAISADGIGNSGLQPASEGAIRACSDRDPARRGQLAAADTPGGLRLSVEQQSPAVVASGRKGAAGRIEFCGQTAI